MKKTWIKTAILVILILLSVFQTARLWFDDLSSRNFFYSLLNVTSPDDKISIGQDRDYFIVPKMMATYGLGNENELTIIKNMSRDFEDIFETLVPIIRESLISGEYIENEIRLQELWKSGNILMRYPFEISKQILLEDLGLSERGLSETIKPFDEIVISPAASFDKYIVVYYVTKDQIVQGYKVDKVDIKQANNDLREYIKGLATKEQEHYISTDMFNFGIFADNILLPVKEEFDNEDIYLLTSFEQGGSIDEFLLQEYIINFFSRSITWNLVENNQWFYSDEVAVIKYNTNGVIEYSLTNMNNNNKTVSIVEAYNIASNFLRRDSKLYEQEYYLKKYNVYDDRIVFYYNYRYNGLDIVISNDAKIYYEITYPMEITVTGNQVSNYKRLILEKNSYPSQPPKIQTNYRDVLDEFLVNYTIEGKIEDMYLGYYLGLDNKTLEMKWIVRTEDTINIISLK